MKIYARTRELDKEKRIRQLIGKEIWTRILILGDDYFARFVALDGPDVTVNIITGREIDYARDNSTYGKSQLRKSLSVADTPYETYVDHMTFFTRNDVYTTEELYELAGIEATKITNLEDLVDKDLWLKCDFIYINETAFINITSLLTDTLQAYVIPLDIIKQSRQGIEEAQDFVSERLSKQKKYLRTIDIPGLELTSPLAYYTTEEMRESAKL